MIGNNYNYGKKSTGIMQKKRKKMILSGNSCNDTPNVVGDDNIGQRNALQN